MSRNNRKDTSKSTNKLNRRGFLHAAVGTGMGLLIISPRTAFAYEANERLNLAMIGMHGRGNWVPIVPQLHTLDNVTITAMCDVDDRKLGPVFKLWEDRAKGWVTSPKEIERKGAAVYQRMVDPGTKPPLYRDFRKMLDEMDRHIDAVVCATPDHTHSVISAAALRAGKHVYAEKPLTLRVGEARALRQLAAERPNLATSMGNQGTATKGFRRGLEVIRQGLLGEIREVHIWFTRGGKDHQQTPAGPEIIPPDLHWDLWLGPVASRPYNPNWIARNHWRETGIGELGNWMPHTANLAVMALNIRDLWNPAAPSSTPPIIRVQAEVPNINRISFPVWERIQWHVPARAANSHGLPMPPVTINWYHGGPPPEFGPGDRQKIQARVRELGGTPEQAESLLGDSSGALIVGSEGALITNNCNTYFHLMPEEKFKHITRDSPLELPLSLGHTQDWLAACRGGSAPMPRANFGFATTFLELINLGDLATRFSPDVLEYDPIAGRILNHPEANQRLGPNYRRGWTL